MVEGKELCDEGIISKSVNSGYLSNYCCIVEHVSDPSFNRSFMTDTTLNNTIKSHTEMEIELTNDLRNHSNEKVRSFTVVSSRDDPSFTVENELSCKNFNHSTAFSLSNEITTDNGNKPLFVILEPIFAEPLFTGIKYGNLASENYMIIEPLLSEFTESYKAEKISPHLKYHPKDQNLSNPYMMSLTTLSQTVLLFL